MNIFLVDKLPMRCAQALCDLRLNKMILETAQLLCTSHRHWFGDHPDLYRVTHYNHPCSIWLREDINNHKWLLRYFEHLYTEKEYRTGKQHLSYLKLCDILYTDDDISFLQPNFNFNCTGIYPSTGNVFADYKLCLLQKWIVDKREPTFINRVQPDFISFDLAEVRKQYQMQKSQFLKDLYLRHSLITDPIWIQYK